MCTWVAKESLPQYKLGVDGIPFSGENDAVSGHFKVDAFFALISSAFLKVDVK